MKFFYFLTTVVWFASAILSSGGNRSRGDLFAGIDEMTIDRAQPGKCGGGCNA